MRWMLQPVYRVQRHLWRLLRPRTRGVKVLLFNPEGELLLIRNSYGCGQFVLPGGGVRPWEEPAAAARREIAEEVGCSTGLLTLVATYTSSAEGKRDTIHLFTAATADVPVPDAVEVVEAFFAAPTRLPPNTSPATRRRVDEQLGRRARSATW